MRHRAARIRRPTAELISPHEPGPTRHPGPCRFQLPGGALGGVGRRVAYVGGPVPDTASFAPDGDLPPDDPMCLGVYLAAGEAVTNAVKHSGLHRDHPAPHGRPGDSAGHGAGQRHRRCRVTYRGAWPAGSTDLHGSVQVESRAGRGTTVRITARRTTGGVGELPLPRDRRRVGGSGHGHRRRLGDLCRVRPICPSTPVASPSSSPWRALSAPVLGTVVLRRHPRGVDRADVVRRGDHRDAVRVADCGARCAVPADRGDRVGHRLAAGRGRGPATRRCKHPAGPCG